MSTKDEDFDENATGPNESNIYQERDFFLNLNACLFLMLSEAATVGEKVIQVWIESVNQYSYY